MVTIGERLQTFIKSLNISKRKFDLSIGAANGYTSKVLKNNGAMGSNFIEKVATVYPQLNLRWLIKGEGNMLVPHEKVENNLAERSFYELIDSRIEAKLKSQNTHELMKMIIAGMIDDEILKTKNDKVK